MRKGKNNWKNNYINHTKPPRTLYVCAASTIQKDKNYLAVISVTASSVEEAVRKLYFTYKRHYPNETITNYTIDEVPITTLQKLVAEHNDNSKHPYPIITLN